MLWIISLRIVPDTTRLLRNSVHGTLIILWTDTITMMVVLVSLQIGSGLEIISGGMEPHAYSLTIVVNV